MATPPGYVEKLYFNTESGTYPTAASFSTTAGLRMYFDRFRVEAPKSTQQGYEFGASDSAGVLHPDQEDFAEGDVAVGCRLDWTMRYSGVHAVLLGLALGDLTTGSDGGLADFYHRATLTSGQDTATFVHQLAKTDTSTFVEQQVVGCKAESLVLEQEVGRPMRASMRFIGAHANFSTSVSSSLPPNSGAYIPGESRIHWHQLYTVGASSFVLTMEGRTGVVLRCRRWKIALQNGIGRLYTHNGDTRTQEPVRVAPRSVVGEFEIEQNDEWREAMQAHGYLYNTATTDTDISIIMTSGYGEAMRIQLNNCRLVNVGRDSEAFFSKYQRFQAVARQQIGGASLDSPLRITMYTNYSGTAPGYYGNMVTPS